MDPLNHEFEFERDANEEVRLAFSGMVRRLLLPLGIRLWKWTDHEVLPGRRVSPWWLPLEPERVEGFENAINLRELERQITLREGGPRSTLRPALAILPEWNGMQRMLIVNLLIPAFGFAGFAAMQQMNDLENQPMPVFLAGGHPQLFIPNLTSDHIETCDARVELASVGVFDTEFWLSPFAPEIHQRRHLHPKTRRLLGLFGLLTPEETNES